MKTIISKLLFAGLIISGVAFTGCSKDEAVNDLNNNPQLLTINNNASADDGTNDVPTGMFNRDLGIVYASDGKFNTSSQYSNYTFKFTGTQPTGEAMVTTNQGTMIGTWSSRDGSDVFVMDFQNTTLAERAYLSREWRMQPSTSAYTMTLVAPDGDKIELAGK